MGEGLLEEDSLLGQGVATAQFSKRDRAVAQVLYNTVFMDPDAGAPDDATVRDYRPVVIRREPRS